MNLSLQINLKKLKENETIRTDKNGGCDTK